MARSNDFQFKQFKISQQNAGMKVGTDGVLLGASAPIENTQSILDVGTGTGLIALMLAQRSDATVTGIELEEEAYCDACLNVVNSPWPDRIELIHSSFQDFAEKTPVTFDLIVSNPPYFVNSLKNPCDKRTAARHTDNLTYSELLKGSERLLSSDGHIYLVFPADQLRHVQEKAHSVGLWEQRITSVHTKFNKPAKRVLLLLSRQKPVEAFHEKLIIHADHSNDYSSEFIQLTRTFYLKF